MLAIVLYISISLIKPFVVRCDDVLTLSPTKSLDNDSTTQISLVSTEAMIQDNENISSRTDSNKDWKSMYSETSQSIISQLQNSTVPVLTQTDISSSLGTSHSVSNPIDVIPSSTDIFTQSTIIIPNTTLATSSSLTVNYTNITGTYSVAMSVSQTTQSPHTLSSTSNSLETVTSVATNTPTDTNSPAHVTQSSATTNENASSPTITGNTQYYTTDTVTASYSSNTPTRKLSSTIGTTLISTLITSNKISSEIITDNKINPTQSSLSSSSATTQTSRVSTTEAVIPLPSTVTTKSFIDSSTLSYRVPVSITQPLILYEELLTITLTNEIWFEDYRNKSSNLFKVKVSEIQNRLITELQYLQIYKVEVFDLKPGSIIANTSLIFSQFITRCNIASSIEANYSGASVTCASIQSKLPTWSVILISVLCVIMAISSTVIIVSFLLCRRRHKTHGTYDVELCEKKNGWEYPYRYMIHQKSRL